MPAIIRDSDISHQIQIPSKPVKNLVDKPSSPVIYSSMDYGLSSDLTGKGIKIVLIDTGCPIHDDIKNNIIEPVNFCEHVESIHDNFGHATMVAGIIAANNDSTFKGIAPNCSLYPAKISDNDGKCDFNAIVAAVLWAVVKRMDIILLPLGSPFDYPVLHSAIKKAFDTNIVIIAAANGDGDSKSKQFYPASYSEVFSFKAKPKGKDIKNHASSKQVILSMPNSGIYTTYAKNKYSKVYGSSFAAGIGAGLAALLIEKQRKQRKQGTEPTPRKIYASLRALCMS